MVPVYRELIFYYFIGVNIETLEKMYHFVLILLEPSINKQGKNWGIFDTIRRMCAGI